MHSDPTEAEETSLDIAQRAISETSRRDWRTESHATNTPLGMAHRLVTPDNDRLHFTIYVDLDTLETNIEAVIPIGTMGEFLVSGDEARSIYEAAVNHIRGKS